MVGLNLVSDWSLSRSTNKEAEQDMHIAGWTGSRESHAHVGGAQRAGLAFSLCVILGIGFCAAGVSAEDDPKSSDEKTEEPADVTQEATEKPVLAPPIAPLEQAEEEKVGAVPQAGLLPEVVIIGTRIEEDAFTLPRAISVVDRGRILRRRASAGTPAELLRGEPGIFLQQTGRRGGAPIIRGLIGKFILPMYDGVRLTDGTIFAGPNGFFNNVDRYTIDRIEVVRGPASVLYGSDAVGGTLNMFPRRFEGFPDRFQFDVGVYGGWRSANNQFTGRVEVGGGGRRFHFLVGGTLVDAGNTRGGGGLGALSNTSWSEKNFDARVGYQLSPGHVLEAAYWRTQREDVYRFDQPWETPHQNDWWKAHESLYLTGSGLRKRMNKAPLATTQVGSLTYSGENPASFWKEVKAKLYWRREYDKTVRGSEQTTTWREDTTTRQRDVFGAAVQFTSGLGRRGRITYGVDSRLDDVDSGTSFRGTIDKTTGATISTIARTPSNPDAKVFDLGAFAYAEHDTSARMTLSAGVRLNHTNVSSDPTVETTPSPLTPDELRIDTNYSSVTWGVGSVYKISTSLNAIGHVGTAFRSPSISDMLRTGEFTYGVGVPSPGVDPEHAITFEAGLRSRRDRSRWGVTVYRTNLRDLIESRPGTFGGSDFIDLNGDGIKQPDEQVYVKENVGEAYVWGIETEGEWELYRRSGVGSLFVFGNATYTRGRNSTDDEPLRFIPPLNGIVGARWDNSAGRARQRQRWVELSIPWAIRKRKKDFSPSDLADLAQFPREPGKLPGWALLDLRAGIELSRVSTLTLSITNLLDSEYQSFASRLPGDGRSVNCDFSFEW